jgi:hypothetical protein
MHALTVLVPARSVDGVCDVLADEHEALAVSVEDADAGSEAEQAVFDEPGSGPTGHWERARVSALFADEAAAVAAAAGLAASAAGTRGRHAGFAEQGLLFDRVGVGIFDRDRQRAEFVDQRLRGRLDQRLGHQQLQFDHRRPVR